MTTTIKTILIAIICFFVQQYFPWWSAVAVAFGVNVLISGSNGKAFLSGFLGVGLLWLIMAIWIDFNTNSILTERMAQVLQINNKYLLILGTTVIGGLSGGMGALSGSTFRKLFEKKKSKY